MIKTMEKVLEQKVYTFGTKLRIEPEKVYISIYGKQIGDITLMDLFQGDFSVSENTLIGYSILEFFGLEENKIVFFDSNGEFVLVGCRNKIIQMNDVEISSKSKEIIETINSNISIKKEKREFKQVETLLKNNYNVIEDGNFIFGWRDGDDSEPYLFEVFGDKLKLVNTIEQDVEDKNIRMFVDKNEGIITVYLNEQKIELNS
jgi:hypothetical protein